MKKMFSLKTLKSKIKLLNSFSDWFYLVQGNLNLFLYNKNLLSKHLKDQINYRITLDSTKECLMAGECLNCGCYIKPKICSNKPDTCYPQFMKKLDWTIYKNQNQNKP